MSSVFAQLNQGEGVTKGLRKVDKSEMTHKNPELRSAGVVQTSGASRYRSQCSQSTLSSDLIHACRCLLASFAFGSSEAAQADCDAEEAGQEGAGREQVEHRECAPYAPSRAGD